MRKLCLLNSALLGSVLLVGTPDVFAQSKPSAVQALEFSLKSLYDSAKEVDKKNQWLREEIERMNQEAIFLREEIKSMETAQAKRQIEDAGQPGGALEKMPWEEERANMMVEDLAQLNEEEAYLKDRLEGKENDQRDIEQAVIALQRDVAKLNKERAELKKKLQQPPEGKDLERAKVTLARSERNLEYAQKKYDRLEKKFGAPLKEFKDSRIRNKELKTRVDTLQKQLLAARETEGRLENELASMEQDGQLGALNKEIDTLAAERQELVEGLEKAQVKLGKDFRIPDYDSELQTVEENIRVIQEENRDLKGKLIELENRIRPGDKP